MSYLRGGALSQQTTTLNRVENRDDHVWLDVDISYDENQLFLQNSTLAKYRSTKTESIVNNPSLYHLIIDRFEIPGYFIPSYIHLPNNPGTITLSYNGFSVNQDLIYNVRSTDLTPSDAGYYYIYDFQEWIDMLNTAFESAFTNLGALVALPAGSEAPYLVWDSETQRFKFYAQEDNYDYTDATPIQVFLNQRIYLQLPFFPYIRSSMNSWQLLFSNYKNNIVSIGGDPWIELIQQANGASYWNTVKSIVFTSNTIPVKNTYTTVNNSLQNNQNSSASSLAILTDFILDANNPLDQRTHLNYNGMNDYRRLDLYGTSPLRQIDVNVYWVDYQNNLNPIRIPVNERVNIKMLFVKKTSNV